MTYDPTKKYNPVYNGFEFVDRLSAEDLKRVLSDHFGFEVKSVRARLKDDDYVKKPGPIPEILDIVVGIDLETNQPQ